MVPEIEKIYLDDMVEMFSKQGLNFRSVLGVRKLHATLALAWYDRVHYVQDVLGHTGPLQEGYHPRSARMPESFVHAE